MVIIDTATVMREQQKRGWDDLRLASEMDVSEKTVRNMFDEKPVGTVVQGKLFRAFGGDVSADDLFVVVVDEPQGENTIAAAAATGS